MRVGLTVAAFGLLFLAGCSIQSSNQVNQPEATPAATVPGGGLTGSVHGGQQPIVGAHVYLFQANTTGYGGGGIAASSNNASKSLLTSAGTTKDTSGGPTNGDYFVTTGANGAFSITGDYACTQGAPVYLYALGGDSGSGPNSAVGLLAALGVCPSAHAFPSTMFVYMNEVSTVATAYALAGFASDAVHVGSSGTTLAQTGIANAVATVTNLEDVGTGVALLTTPGGNGTYYAQRKVNTLANILAACVNSTGPGSTACSTLLSNTLSGGATGAAPTDTATATINMAHNPSSNIANLFALATANPPFAPAAASQPNDFTVAIQFTGAGLANPSSVAIDASGNVWAANLGNGYSVSELTNMGVPLTTSSGLTTGGLNGPEGIAVDLSGNAWMANVNGNSLTVYTSGRTAMSQSPLTNGGLVVVHSVAFDASGNAWVPNSGRATVTEFSSSFAVLSETSGFSVTGASSPDAVAVDGSGNAWLANLGTATVSKVTNAGVTVSGSPYTLSGVTYPYAIAMDGAGNAWVPGWNNTLSKLTNSGVVATGSPFTGGGLNDPYAVAIDGAGNVWIADQQGGVSEFSNAGVALSGATAYTDGGLNQPYGIAIDGSGNVWVANYGYYSVTEIIGAAAPVITPIAAGLPATPTADGSSNLGTRP
jgi:hypothetical protein